MNDQRMSGLIVMVAALLLGGCAEPPSDEADAVQAPEHASVTGEWDESSDRPDTTVPLSSIRVLDNVLPKSRNYTIDPDVGLDAYYYRFKVRTPHGEYEAVSVRNLVKLGHEIDVLERFRQTDDQNHVWTGISQSASGIGRGAKNLVLHPGQSIKQVGEGAGRFMRATGRIFTAPFREKKPRFASNGVDRALLGRGPAGGERRLMAYELGIDVYTGNPAVQELLNEVARKRVAGKLPLTASVFALPGGTIFALSLTPMGHDPSTEELIRDHSPEELKRVLALRYLEQFGLDYEEPGDPVDDLLDNPNYSPREQAYIWRYLTDLQGVQGVDAAMKFLADQYSVERASIVSAQLELLSLLHSRVPKRRLVKFVPVRNTLGAVSGDNTLCLVISVDTVRFWGDVKTSLELSLKAARKTGADRIEIWSTGDVDEKSVKLANRMGVYVYQNILQHEVFRRPRPESVEARQIAETERLKRQTVDTPAAPVEAEPHITRNSAPAEAERIKPAPVRTTPPAHPSPVPERVSEPPSGEKPSMVETYW